MKIHIKNTSSKIIIVVIIMCVLVTAKPFRARAIWPVTVDADVSYTSIQRTMNSVYTYVKDFVTDHLAVRIAQQVIQQMTASIITWINTGFNGSPTFLTNPESFFMNAGDQIVGRYIDASSTVAQALCSPFSKDIRIAIAIDRVQPQKDKYKCTLSAVVANAKNASIDGFTAGDFSQGGWPAFVAMTSQPQNNPLGAYAQVNEDINDAITKKQSTINLDLTRGNGFLSYQTCKDVPVGEWYYDTNYGVQTQSEGIAGLDQECTTETPGSVVSNTLYKQLGAPTDKLNLVKSINDIIDAALNQMIYQLVNTGLASLSRSSGNKKSYADQLVVESNSTDSAAAKDVQSRTASSLKTQTTSLQSAVDAYTETILLVTKSQTLYQTALSCFVTKSTNNASLSSPQLQFAQTNIANITTVLEANINPLIADLTQKQANIQGQLDSLLNYSSTDGLTPAQLLENANRYAEVAGGTIGKKGGDANTYLVDIQDRTKIFNQDAGDYQRACNRFPTVY